MVLVERKYQPFGWALPGGFIEYGETAEDAAVREAFEETGLEVEIERLLGVYSDPKRDCRKHVLSVCYVAHSFGEPKAGDDAKGIAVVNEKELENFIREKCLAFDHEKILMDYLESEKGR
ncbi:MAG: NUDIX hydrolase [Candidatus Woesearchaeota archaeon]|nr:NUDIX hydrolase [Candidatus Woesearchaeota archaeon]